MRLLVNTDKITFTVSLEAQPKTDQNGRQKADRITAELLWTVQVMVLDEKGGDVITVTVAGLPPKVTVGQAVRLVDLEAIPWATNGRNGVAYRASAIQPLQVAGPKAA